MSLRPLAHVLVKLLGLYTGLQSLNALQMVWNPLLRVLGYSAQGSLYLDFVPSWMSVLPGVIVGVAQIAAGVVLWRYSPQISGAIVGEEEPTDAKTTANWQRVALGVVGAYLMADSVCRIVLAVVLSMGEPGSKWSSTSTPLILSSVLRGFLGFWTWLGAKGIWRTIRNVGRDMDREVQHET